MIQRDEQLPVGDERGSAPPDGRPLAAQPKWRRDFPIDWPHDEWVSRREFTRFLVLTSGALAVGQLWIAAKSLLGASAPAAPELQVAKVDELPVGRARTFHYPAGSPPRILVRTAAGFVAYDQQCTHLLCPVIPAVEQGRLYCPCHEGWFDLETGRPLAGPPQRPLPKIRLKVVEGRVFATGIEEQAR